jgi:dynein heavy chain
MNPKAITAPQMFGRMDPATGDWTDGVFSVLWRRAARAPKGQATWIVLDGPVDAVWIENLNTVLDDNKVLTLANGDRVLMTPQMRLIFEPENLANASPATVSRAGIIFFSDSELGWRPVAASWLAGRPEREAAALRPCFERLVEPALEFVRAACAPVMRTEAVCKVATLLTLLTAVLGPSTKAGSGGGGAGEADAGGAGGAAGGALRREESSASVASAIVSGQSEGGEAADAARCERHFLYCLAWGVGGLLDPGDRARFDAHLRGLTRLAPAPLEAGDTLFEFLVDDNSGEWQHWRERVPAWRFPAPAPGGPAPRFSQMIVPTLDSVRYERLLALVHSVGKASLVGGWLAAAAAPPPPAQPAPWPDKQPPCGPTPVPLFDVCLIPLLRMQLVGGPGTAKTCIVQQFLSRFDPDAHVARTVTFSSLTSPAIFQTAVEGAMEKRQGRTYGPSGGKSMALFVDDLAMPALNAWGDQITNELVRQLLEQGGFYSLDKPVGDLKQFVDTRYVAAMSLPAAGRSDIPNRLKRQFCVFNVPPPSPGARAAAGSRTPRRLLPQ